ncbi:hypothetical protein TNCV_4853241 [Trichonephila clavipes]|nr:hypothetical protein TNCV_4853241 [Trichonephila clavipes]
MTSSSTEHDLFLVKVVAVRDVGSYYTADVDLLHHENPPTWAGVEPTTLGTEGKRENQPRPSAGLEIYSK